MSRRSGRRTIRDVRRRPARPRRAAASTRVQVVRASAAAARTIVEARELWDRPIDVRATRRYLADPRNLVLLALEHGRPVGLLRGTVLGQLRGPASQFFLYEIGVGPTYRRRGVGRALVRTMVRWARARGCEEAFVLTDPGNRAAVRLYRSTGGRTETPRDRMFVYRLGRRPARRLSAS